MVAVSVLLGLLAKFRACEASVDCAGYQLVALPGEGRGFREWFLGLAFGRAKASTYFNHFNHFNQIQLVQLRPCTCPSLDRRPRLAASAAG